MKNRLIMYDVLHRFYNLELYGPNGVISNQEEVFKKLKVEPSSYYMWRAVDALVDGEDGDWEVDITKCEDATDLRVLAPIINRILKEYGDKYVSLHLYIDRGGNEGSTIMGRRQETDEEFEKRAAEAKQRRLSKERAKQERAEKQLQKRIAAAKKLLEKNNIL
jgi:hypothetical protein